MKRDVTVSFECKICGNVVKTDRVIDVEVPVSCGSEHAKKSKWNLFRVD